MKILIIDSYRARKMIRIHLKDLLNSSYGQSYGHLKVAHATSVLDTPLIRLWLHKYYASRPPRAKKGALRAMWKLF